jgi:hypothetical protein
MYVTYVPEWATRSVVNIPANGEYSSHGQLTRSVQINLLNCSQIFVGNSSLSEVVLDAGVNPRFGLRERGEEERARHP